MGSKFERPVKFGKELYHSDVEHWHGVLKGMIERRRVRRSQRP